MAGAHTDRGRPPQITRTGLGATRQRNNHAYQRTGSMGTGPSLRDYNGETERSNNLGERAQEQ